MSKSCTGVWLVFLSVAIVATQVKSSSSNAAMAGVRYFDKIFSSYTKTSDLTYGQAFNVSTGQMETLKLDLYEPSGDTEPYRAAIIWVHPGGLIQGDKGDPKIVQRCDEFSKRGYVAVSNNYRLWTDGSNAGSEALRQAYEDTKATVRWLRANAARYRIDVNRISVGGTSSGGFIALSTAYEENEGDSGNPGYSSEVSACYDGSGALEDDTVMEIGEAPLLVMHGDQDENVPYSEALELEARALQVGIPYELHTLAGQDHSWTDAERMDFINKSVDFNYRYVIQTASGGAPAVTVSDVAVAEGNSGTYNAVFTLNLSAPTLNGQVVTFDYATANGSASAGSDYVAKSGTFSIPAGETSQTLTITINGDTDNEGDETFFLNLKKPANARLTDLQGVGTIQNDDLAGAPAAPTGLTATAMSATQVDLNWNDNSTNEDGFRIERKTGAAAFAEIATVAAQMRNYSDANVSPATAYTYRVHAYNDIANSGYSNEASATTPCDVVAAFNANLTSGCAPLSVNFTDQSSPQSGATAWSWNFGDGGTATTQNPTHVFNTPGTYTVTLTAISASCNDAETKTNYITVTGAPTANFTATPIAGNAPLTVNFTDQSTNNPTAWSWNFGDGGNSTAKNPSRQYTAPGTYTVTLTATNACGADGETKVGYITVSNTPVNLALNKPATASSTSGSNTPSRAVDGSTSTYWRSGSISSSTLTWLRVDLQSAASLTRLVIKWNGSYYARNYQAQVSNDNVNWSTVYADNSGNGGNDDFSFGAVTARYVRIYMTKNNKSSERINELEVYGTASSSLKFEQATASTVAAFEAPAALQSYPNPFNPQTMIRFTLPGAEHVRLWVCNTLGQEVARLVDEPRAAGTHEILFDARALPSGVYFSVLQMGAEKRVQRLLLMK